LQFIAIGSAHLLKGKSGISVSKERVPGSLGKGKSSLARIVEDSARQLRSRVFFLTETTLNRCSLRRENWKKGGGGGTRSSHKAIDLNHVGARPSSLQELRKGREGAMEQTPLVRTSGLGGRGGAGEPRLALFDLMVRRRKDFCGKS